MSELTVTKEILCHGDFTDAFAADICVLLERLIDAELQKGDQADCDLIDECTEAILVLSGYEEIIAPSGRFYPYIYQRKRMLIALCASFAVVVVLGTAAVLGTGSDSYANRQLSAVYEKIGALFSPESEQTVPSETTAALTETPPTTEENTETSAPATKASEETKKASAVGTTQTTSVKPTEESTKAAEIPVSSLYGTFSDAFVSEYEDREDISYNGVTVHAKYADGSEKTVPLKDCAVSVGSADSGGRIKILISYEGKSFSYYVRVVSKEVKDPVTLNSIYGVFENGYDPDGMRVYAVYSDGSEKEIPVADCTVTREYNEAFGMDIVTVSYQGCSFSFAPDAA